MPASSLLRFVSLAGAIACSAGTVAAQPAGPAPTPAPCRATEYRQFDFWVGDWDVHTPDGKPAGSNRIERTLGGCALRETWKGAGGVNGTSLSSWDPGTRRWHQTWVGDDGVLLKLEGGLRAGKMVLLGETVSENGERALPASRGARWRAGASASSGSSPPTRESHGRSPSRGSTARSRSSGPGR